jgi:hypothetical protein
VKKGAFPARLTRAAYYQLVETLELDKTVNRYFIAADVGRMYL